MSIRLNICGAVAAACLVVPAMAQVPQLVNGNLDTPDPVFLQFGVTKPLGMRLYNYSEYRWLGDGLTPTTMTHSGNYSVRLPGGEGRNAGEFEAVHSEEPIDLNDVNSPRNWPQYTFNPPNGQPLTVSCWFNIPANDPVIKSRFGIKLNLLNGTNPGVFFAREWLDVDPEAATAFPGCTIVTVNTPEGPEQGIHTNGQWVHFVRTLQQSEIVIPDPATNPDWVPPTNPAHVSMLALRFDIFPPGGTPAPVSHGTVWVDDLTFSQGAACPADFNNSGSLSVQDIFDFLGAWFAGNTSADYNNNGHLEVQDIFDFLSGWFAGC